MSDYLTNLAITLTTPEPAIRPRLGARFEPVRPARLPNLAPAAVDAAPVDLEIVERPAVAAHQAAIAAPAPPVGSPGGAPARATPASEANDSTFIRPRRRTQPATLSEPPAGQAPTAPPNPVQQTRISDRSNAPETTPRPPQLSSAASSAPAEQLGLPMFKATIETTPNATPGAAQHQGEPAGAPGTPETHLAPEPAIRAESMRAAPLPRLIQPVAPATPQRGRLASRGVQSAANLSQPARLDPVEPATETESIRRNGRLPAHEEQPLAQPPPIRPALASTASVIETARPFAGAQRAPAAPTIRVTIGRVEVRVTPPATPVATPKAASRKPVVSLEEYLAQRNGDRR